MVLEAIYEPVFQRMNCSFGLRASNGCREAIVSIADNSTGFTTAIEGENQPTLTWIVINCFLFLENALRIQDFLTLCVNDYLGMFLILKVKLTLKSTRVFPRERFPILMEYLPYGNG